MLTLFLFVLAIIADRYIQNNVSDSIFRYIIYSILGFLIVITYKTNLIYNIFSWVILKNLVTYDEWEQLCIRTPQNPTLEPHKTSPLDLIKLEIKTEVFWSTNSAKLYI